MSDASGERSGLVVEFDSSADSSAADVSFDELGGSRGAVERAARLLREVEAEVREAYVRWIGDRSVEAMNGSGPAGRRFDDIPAWWLSSASMRDNEADPTFERLCTLVAVDRALRAEHPARLIARSPDAAMDAVLARLAEERDIEYVSVGVKRLRTGPSLTRVLLGRARVAARLIAAGVIAAVFPPVSRRPGGVVFLSVWPETFSLNGAPCDSSFRGLLDAGRRELGAGTLLLLAPSPRRPRELARLSRRARSVAISALARHTRPGDLARVVRSVSIGMACARAARAVRRAGGHRFMGIDARELLDLPLLGTLSRAELGYNLALAAQAERWSRRERPAAIISGLEFYPVARAIYHGARRGHPAVRVIALQHATVTPGKLWYALDPRESSGGDAGMPLPDLVMCQGESARDLLEAGGISPDRLVLTGSPRYDELRPAKAIAPPSDRRILVLPSLDERDAALLVRACVKACARIGDAELVVLPHPLRPLALRDLDDTGQVNLKEERRALSDALSEADVVIASYSTAADEAIARGIPVIAFAGLRPFMGAVAWTQAAPVARTPEQLAELIEAAFAAGGLPDEGARRRHIMWAFHQLDGRATERCLAAIRVEAGIGRATEDRN